MRPKIVHIVGARPNFVKMAPVHHKLSDRGVCQNILHIGQHYDDKMSSEILSDLNLPIPDYNLDVGSNTHAKQLAKMMTGMEEILIKLNPNCVFVYGDVNTTLAGAITAKKLNLKVAHVESGLRSGDVSMPEEQNRKMVDSISDLLFVTEESGMINLRKENCVGKAYFVGNTMIDSLSNVFIGQNKDYKDFVIISFHRPSNVDNKDSLKSILEFIKRADQTFLWPIHYRAKYSIESFGLDFEFNQLNNLKMVEPMVYSDFIKIVSKAKCVITDSGGVQEETTYLNIPCLTYRTSTERPATIDQGSNTLAPTFDIVEENLDKIGRGTYKTSKIPQYWDGKASERIVKQIQLLNLFEQ